MYVFIYLLILYKFLLFVLAGYSVVDLIVHSGARALACQRSTIAKQIW